MKKVANGSAPGPSGWTGELLEAVLGDVDCLLEPIQFSFSRGGCERAVHLLQAALELDSTDSVLLSVDFSNAFNTLRRDVLLSRTFDEARLSPLWRLAHWAYKSPSDLLLSQAGDLVGVLSSAEGVRQGDVLSSFLFSFSVLPLYSAALSAAPGVCGVAIMDDFELVGPADRVLAAFDRVSELASAYGLSLQRRKCALLWPRASPVPVPVSEGCSSRSLSVVRERAFLFSCP